MEQEGQKAGDEDQRGKDPRDDRRKLFLRQACFSLVHEEAPFDLVQLSIAWSCVFVKGKTKKHAEACFFYGGGGGILDPARQSRATSHSPHLAGDANQKVFRYLAA